MNRATDTKNAYEQGFKGQSYMVMAEPTPGLPTYFNDDAEEIVRMCAMLPDTPSKSKNPENNLIKRFYIGTSLEKPDGIDDISDFNERRMHAKTRIAKFIASASFGMKPWERIGRETIIDSQESERFYLGDVRLIRSAANGNESIVVAYPTAFEFRLPDIVRSRLLDYEKQEKLNSEHRTKKDKQIALRDPQVFAHIGVCAVLSLLSNENL